MKPGQLGSETRQLLKGLPGGELEGATRAKATPFVFLHQQLPLEGLRGPGVGRRCTGGVRGREGSHQDAERSVEVPTASHSSV